VWAKVHDDVRVSVLAEVQATADDKNGCDNVYLL
jgi:hypothetical protein